MTRPRLIALTGPSGVGKTEVAQIIKLHYKYQHVNFSDPWKRMLKSLGLSEVELNGDLREVPNDLLCGQTPRHAENTLGQWGRHSIGQDFWITIWKGIVRDMLKHNYSIICDGCKLLREAAAVRALGGEIWRIQRPGIEPRPDLDYEAEISRISFDKRFFNDGSIADLRSVVEKTLDGHSGHHRI